MSSDPVEAYFEDALAALAALGQHEPSLSVALRASFSKGLLLAAASAFESRLASHLESLYRQRLPDRPDLVAFVVSAGIKRRYHTYFSWDSSNANQFFGLFGPDRATQLKNQFGANPACASSCGSDACGMNWSTAISPPSRWRTRWRI